jgi:hypothetical protein
MKFQASQQEKLLRPKNQNPAGGRLPGLVGD